MRTNANKVERLPLLPCVALCLVVGVPSVWADAGPSARAARIRGFYQRWAGTPYQWGGTTRGGIDCSAYLRQMFRDLFNIELPRTTRQQIRLGVDLSINSKNPGRGLVPGDLIFYVDRTGTPNHVVIYAGSNQITHSVSGRGVVLEPIRKIFGRRVVARRFLVPSRGGAGSIAGFGPIPAAGPIIPKEIPCPPSFRARAIEVRRYTNQPIQDIKAFGEREICDFRALAKALKRRGGPQGRRNAKKLKDHAEWLESIEALKGTIGRGW